MSQLPHKTLLTRLTLEDVEDFCLIDLFPDLKHLKTALAPVGDELAAILENSVAKLESLNTQFIFQCPVRDPTCHSGAIAVVILFVFESPIFFPH